VGTTRTKFSRRFSLFSSSAAAVLVITALLALAMQAERDTKLMQGSDEKMKGWEEGMFPPDATFPAGYHFGDNNVFGKRAKFGAGDTFGNNNVFGKGSVFGAGVSIGDDNNFAKDQAFGPGLRMGSRETVGARSEFAAGAQIGDENQFGRKIKFGRRVSIGEKNQFGFKDEFGSNDQIGQKNEFGRGDVFGSKVLLYKKQQFGPRNAFHKSVYLSGFDSFGEKDWGLDTDKMPKSDLADWNNMESKNSGWFPPRDVRDKALMLHSDHSNQHFYKHLQNVVSQPSSNKSKAAALRQIAAASQAAATETNRLENVLNQLKEVERRAN